MALIKGKRQQYWEIQEAKEKVGKEKEKGKESQSTKYIYIYIYRYV